MMSGFSGLMKHAVLSGGYLTALLTIAHLSMDTLTSMPMALLPVLQSRFGLTESAIALLVATLSFSASVTQPLFGALSDRFGRRSVAALGLILNAVLLSLVGIVPTIALMFVLFFMGGLGSGALHPAGASLVRAGTEHNKGLAVSLFSTGGTLGYALGPVIILYLISNQGLEAMPWLMIPGVLLGLLVYRLAPTHKPLPREERPRLFDIRIIWGPVGLLSVVGILSGLAFVTFNSAVPLWLVAKHQIAPDDPLIGWTLGAFSLAAALGGLGAATLSNRIDQRLLVSGTLLLAPIPMFWMFSVEPGSLPFYIAIILTGALVHANLPLLVVSAQNLAPNAMATASGMLMGFSTGIAGLLYIGIGRLQEMIGLVPATYLSYLAVIPAALLAFFVLSKFRSTSDHQKRKQDSACLCSISACMPLVSPRSMF